MSSAATVIEEDQETFDVDGFLKELFTQPPQGCFEDLDDDGSGDKSLVRLVGVRTPEFDASHHYKKLGLHRDPQEQGLYFLFTDLDEERRGHIEQMSISVVHPLLPIVRIPFMRTQYSVQESGGEHRLYFEGSRIEAPTKYQVLQIVGTRISTFRRKGEEGFPTAEVNDRALNSLLGPSEEFISRYKTEEDFLEAAQYPRLWHESEERFGQVYDKLSALFPNKEGFYEQTSPFMLPLSFPDAPLGKFLPRLSDIVVEAERSERSRKP